MRRSPFASNRSATMLLLIANVVIFVLGYILSPQLRLTKYLALSWDGLAHGYIWQLLTFQFLHGGLLHLILNCWVIYVFGRELEETLGVKRFLTLYLLSGVFGGLVQAMAGGLATYFHLTGWGSQFIGPTVGASAGALGLLAAFSMLYPERPLTLLLFFIIPVSMRAKFLLLFSALIALLGIIRPTGNLADAAHLGGMMFGVFYIRYALHWDWHWPQFKLPRRKSSKRLVKVHPGPSTVWAPKTSHDEPLPPEDFLSKEVDPILDKISAHGIQSLTERERRILEAAREKMGKR